MLCYTFTKYILTDQILNNKMMLIKRFLTSLSIIICIVVVILSLLILSSSQGYLNNPIKKVIEFYCNKKGMKIHIGNLQVKNNILLIDKIFVDLANNTQGEITDFKISFTIGPFAELNSAKKFKGNTSMQTGPYFSICKYLNIRLMHKLLVEIELFKRSISNIVKLPLTFSIVDIDRLSLISKDNQPVINTKMSARYVINFFSNKITTQLNLSPIKNIGLLDSYGNKLPNGEGFCSFSSKIFKKSKKSISCKLSFGNKASLLFNSILDGSILQVSGNVQNIPIMIYQIAEKVIPDNQIISFLQKYTKDGHIRNGEFNFNFDKNSLEKNILLKTLVKAKMHVVDLEYQYDEDLPTLRKIDTDIIISGTSIKFILNQAYASNSLISNGLITLDWQGVDKSHFIINVTAKGGVSDLVDFLSSEYYNKIKKQGIDLKKIIGIVNLKIGMIVPTSQTIKNTYDISTIITGVNGKAFSNNVILKNAKITGTFNGDKINLIGKGMINGYDSNLLIDVNVTDNNQDDYQNLLKIKTAIVAHNQKFGILKLISGSNVLYFEYKEQKDGQSIIKANANLKNLEFYIDKISIHKKLASEAKFILTGKLYNDLNGDIDFNLSGKNNLKMTGKVKVQDNKYDVTLPVITYNTTDLVGKLLVAKDSLNAEIQGRQLDLSESNMMQFLEKEGDPKNIHLKVDVGKVRLKNNIMLNQLNLQINCNKIKCFSGSLNSRIGTKSFKMLLTDKQDLEQWIVTCDNAGALFRGIGMYNNMKAGIINLTLDTKRHKVKKGEVIPILGGTFDIKRFIATDMSFLTRMVSFVSFPGFLSFILNNKDVMFNNMTGKFNYIGNTINIVDTSATGPFFDFTMKGAIDTNKHHINLRGNIIPSFFFVSDIITKIPIIGKIFSNVVPYSMELNY